jgi:hypothetical protein
METKIMSILLVDKSSMKTKPRQSGDVVLTDIGRDFLIAGRGSGAYIVRPMFWRRRQTAVSASTAGGAAKFI